ncbi:alpha/beta hydrolase [Brachybacterium sacelli]|uniref:Alpha/beta hydrolase fold-5 domain-containing protein n=1 Tax=Brachybacterium sacelli TaxID=173364 RepID=A0ABS4X6I4_9MICO|nr:alpha/beta hydrolase [Brachybacterium sacelli]MBP2384077.1 hypothetical protein [Brachybacterium sacelli]
MTASPRLRSWAFRLLAALAVLVLVAVVALVAWSRIGVMEAEPGPLEEVVQDPRIALAEDSSTLVLQPADGDASPTGLVFYPGAKVAPEAYAARLSTLVTDHGMTVVIVKPWLHLALFDRRGLNTFTREAPEVETWMVGGHSLGGVRACQVAPAVDALVLLGSYCAGDIADSGVPVLSLSGSEDGLSTPDKIAGSRDLLPADATMVEIDGASHASFGDYGPQDGDGAPLISDATTDHEVSAAMAEFLESEQLGAR